MLLGRCQFHPEKTSREQPVVLCMATTVKPYILAAILFSDLTSSEILTPFILAFLMKISFRCFKATLM